MNFIDKIIYLNVYKISKKAFEIVLSDKFQDHIIQDFTKEIWIEYKNRSTSITKKETFGATIMVKLCLLTLIIYEKLISKNFKKQDALQLTYKIIWVIYEKLANKFWVFTRVFSKKPIIRVKKAIYFFINYFPYKSPGYKMEILKTKNNVVAFNVYKCPAAEFFKQHNLSELCVEGWCNLDYPLAKIWKVTLQRQKTIAKGYEMCDFKFLE